MSSELEDLAYRTNAAFQERGVAGWVDLWHEDVVMDMAPTGVPGFTTYRGKAESRRFLEEWRDTFDEWSVDIVGVELVSDEAVLVHWHQTGRVRGGEGEVAMDYIMVGVAENGLWKEITAYLDEEHARRAASERAAGIGPGPPGV